MSWINDSIGWVTISYLLLIEIVTKDTAQHRIIYITEEFCTLVEVEDLKAYLGNPPNHSSTSSSILLGGRMMYGEGCPALEKGRNVPKD